MLPVHVTRIIANRMRLTLTEGLVLNVMTMPVPGTPAEAVLAGIARSALAAVTRGEAAKWAPDGIRVNAVGPAAVMADAGAKSATDLDIAALALHLASRLGRTLTGQVFDAAGVAKRGC
jgi:3-oxoacyl-[acyl-carrier protein] reductase